MKEDITDEEIEKIAKEYAANGAECIEFVSEAKHYRERLKKQSAQNRLPPRNWNA